MTDRRRAGCRPLGLRGGATAGTSSSTTRVDGLAAHRAARRRPRRRRVASSSQPATARPSSCRSSGRRVDVVDADGESTRPSSPGAPTSSPARPTSPTCPRGPRVHASPPRAVRPGRRRAAATEAAHRHARSGTSAAARCRSSCAAPGSASREVRNFGTPGVLDADSIIACEVLTPAGNWSSYPPHKHDEERPGRRDRARGDLLLRGRSADADGTRRHRSGRLPAGLRHRRAARSTCWPRCAPATSCWCPHGWHGPAMAAPGYDLYYLNVMAGPGPERAWLICDDPAHAWVRDTWAGQTVDPRLPVWRHADDAATDRSGSRSRQAVVRFLGAAVDRARRRAAEAVRRVLRHLRPRQRRRHRPGAAPGRARPTAERRTCPTSWPATSRPWCTPRSAYARQQRPPADLGLHRLGRPGLDQHADRRGARDDQPDPGAAAALRHLRDPGRRPGAAGARAAVCRATSPSTTPSARCRGSSTGSAGPSSCRPRCSARCACSPTRSRPAR